MGLKVPDNRGACEGEPLMPTVTAPRRWQGALVTPWLVALTVSACAAGTAAEASVAPSPAASTMAVLDQQAFIDAPAAFTIVPAFGAMWVGGNTAGTVTRIDPVTNAATGTVKVSTFTSDVAATDDAIWVLDGDAEAVRRIDPATAKLTDESIPIGDDGGDLQVARGKLWHTTRDGEVLEIDPVSGEIERWTLPGTCGEGGCGFLVREAAGFAIDDSSLKRIDLTTHEVTATNDTDVATGVFGVGDDALYAGSPSGGVAILDPVTLQLRQAIGSDPVVGPDGGKWSLGLAGENGGVIADDAGAWVRFDAATVGRVDPASGTITVYGGPFPSEFTGGSGIAVSDGSLWVTNVGEGSGGLPGGDPGVYRLALPSP